MGKLVIVDHPLVKHKITFLRSKHTDVQVFEPCGQATYRIAVFRPVKSQSFGRIQSSKP